MLITLTAALLPLLPTEPALQRKLGSIFTANPNSSREKSVFGENGGRGKSSRVWDGIEERIGGGGGGKKEGGKRGRQFLANLGRVFLESGAHPRRLPLLRRYAPLLKSNLLVSQRREGRRGRRKVTSQSHFFLPCAEILNLENSRIFARQEM